MKKDFFCVIMPCKYNSFSLIIACVPGHQFFWVEDILGVGDDTSFQGKESSWVQRELIKDLHLLYPMERQV